MINEEWIGDVWKERGLLCMEELKKTTKLVNHDKL